MIELIGFIALLALGIYLLVVAVATGFGEAVFCGGIGILTAVFFTCACAVLWAAFYLAPFTLSWSAKKRTNQYALGYKAGLEAAVKACRDEENSWVADSIGAKAVEVVRLRIEHLPVPEVQWREIVDDDVLEVMRKVSPATHPQLFARAVIAKFKEVNK